MKLTIILFVLLAVCQGQTNFVYPPYTSIGNVPHYYNTPTSQIIAHGTHKGPAYGPIYQYNPYWPNSKRFTKSKKSSLKDTPTHGVQYQPTYSYTTSTPSFVPQNYGPQFPRHHYNFLLNNQLSPGGPIYQYDAYGNGFVTGWTKQNAQRFLKKVVKKIGFKTYTPYGPVWQADAWGNVHGYYPRGWYSRLAKKIIKKAKNI